MAVCPKCGKDIKTKAKFCPECGTSLGKKSTKEEKDLKEEVKDVGEALKGEVEKILDTEDSTKEFTKKDAKDNLGMALLSYLFFLALIPYFMEKDSKFVKYHAKQGMNLLVVWVAYWVVRGALSIFKFSRETCLTQYKITCVTIKSTPWFISVPMDIISLGIFALAVVGIVYVAQGKAKELPLVNKIKIFK